MQVTLFKYNEAFGLPDVSPFCIKLETYLRMAGIEYQVATGDLFRQAPKKKLPYIKFQGQYVGDSSFIIHLLKEKLGDSLDKDLSNEQRAIARAFQSMLEEHFYFVLGHYRWQASEGWKIYKPHVADVMKKGGAPAFLRPIALYFARRSVIKAMYQQGTGRHSPDEILSIGKAHIDAIVQFLGEKAYFFGDKVTSIDATLYGLMASLIIPPIPSPLQEYAKLQPSLVAYCQRIKSTFWAQ